MSHRNVRRLVGGALVVLPVMVLWALPGPDTEQTKDNPQRPARPSAAPPAGRHPLGGDIGPDTTVWDPYSTFNGITLDLENDRVFMSDRHGVLTYARKLNACCSSQGSDACRSLETRRKTLDAA